MYQPSEAYSWKQTRVVPVRSSGPRDDSTTPTKILNKNIHIIYASGIENTVFFGNPLVRGVQSQPFMYGAVQVYYRDAEDGKLYIHRVDDDTKFVVASQGSVDYEKGDVKFIFPQFATAIGSNDFGQTGIINFIVTPKHPDIETKLQNIVRITKIDVRLTAV